MKIKKKSENDKKIQNHNWIIYKKEVVESVN
jgi:hypothetical protein